MSPAVNPRSCVPPRWLRVRWGWMAVVVFLMLCSASAFGGAFFPVAYCLFLSWVLWRSDRDGGKH